MCTQQHNTKKEATREESAIHMRAPLPLGRNFPCPASSESRTGTACDRASQSHSRRARRRSRCSEAPEECPTPGAAQQEAKNTANKEKKKERKKKKIEMNDDERARNHAQRNRIVMMRAGATEPCWVCCRGSRRAGVRGFPIAQRASEDAKRT